MSQYTFQFNNLAAYASAKASGGSIATALSGVSSTDISRSVVSYIKGIGQAVTDSVNLFVPYAKGGLAGDVLYYTGTEYCWLKSPSDALDGSVLGQNIINTSAIPTSWVRVGAVPTSESKDVQIGMQAYQPGAAMVKVEKLLGNSVAWNQLVKNGNFADESSWSGNGTRTAENNTMIFVSAQTSGTYNGIYQSVSFLSNHKYLIGATIKTNDPSSGNLFVIAGNIASGVIVTKPGIVDNFVELIGIVTCVSDQQNLTVGQINMRTGVTLAIKNVFAFDLTLMFGAGNEPSTVEMFEKLFPLSYYEYNTGGIISNEAAAVKGIGRNLWDEEWEVGSIDNNTGLPVDSSLVIRSKNFIPCLPLTIYYFFCGSNINIRFYLYDSNKNFIQSAAFYQHTYTSHANAAYMKVRTTGEYAPPYRHDICVSLSGPLNGQYEPYKESIAKLDAKKIYGKLNGTGNYVQVFPDGIRSAGTAYDEVDYQSKSAVVRVDGVDLGSLTWGFYELNAEGTREGRMYSNRITDIKTSAIYDLANILCDKYISDTANNTYYHNKDKSIAIGDSSVYVYDSAYTSNTQIAAFKTAMSGVELLYELATPKYYTDLKLSDDNGATFHDLPRPFYYTAGLEMKDSQDTASSVTAPARILASYKPIKK